MKKNVTITKNELKPHQNAKECYIYRIRFIKEYAKNENHQKVRDHCHDSGTFRGAAHSICSLNFNVPKEIPVVFHNGSNYDYHFIIKKLAKETDWKKYWKVHKTFFVPIEKEILKKLIKMIMKIL